MTTVVLALLAAMLVLAAVVFLIRRRFLLSGLGAVTMWRRPAGGRRWSVGVAWYGADELLWYRALSLSVRPQERLARVEVRVTGRRGPGEQDTVLPADVVVLVCATAAGTRELAMDTSTVTGFLSWTESATPGR